MHGRHTLALRFGASNARLAPGRAPRFTLLWLACACALVGACRIQRHLEVSGPDAGSAGAGSVRMHDAAVLPASDATASVADGAQVSPVSESPIAIENRQPGSDSFALAQPARAELAGYASTTSLAAGEAIRLFVNVDHDQDVRWELYRVGYYQGRGARLLAKAEPVRVTVQPSCPIDDGTGLVECHWASAFQVPIEDTWRSGYYAFKLINEAGFDTYVPFVVRDDTRRAPIVVQASVTTWQAYNVWGGTSLYRNNTRDAKFTGARARRVSFDRPYDTRASAFSKESQFVRWLEQRGYDASYVTNVDVEADRGLLAARRLFVTVLHDEYWTVGERDALEQARAQGVSLAFLSANTGYWRIRLDPSASGVPRRIVTCYKSASLDPQSSAADTTTQFRQHPYPRPENELIGEMYGDWSDFDGFPFIVVNHEHWIYAGTSVAEHETLNSIVGVEWDSLTDNGLTPEGIEIVGDSPVVTQVGLPYLHAHASVHYPTPSSFVFAAGSIEWISGLGGKRDDLRVHRMTENLFTRAGFPLAQPTRVEPKAASDVGRPAEAKVLAGNGQPGIADGAAAQFSSPAGVAAAASGELYVADTGNQLVRKIDSTGNVTTLAGCRPDRDPRPTCFTTPLGIAVDARGVVYVSDAAQQRIYAIAKDGTVSVFAGNGKAGLVDHADARSASFATPRGLAFGPSGELYVADFDNAAIRRIDASGVSTVASDLSEVMGVAVDSTGAVYFTSSGDIRLGVVRDGQARSLTEDKVRPLEGVTVSADGLVFADAGGYRVRRRSLEREQDPIVTWLGNGQFGTDTRQLVLPRGIAAARGGYAVADSGNHRIVWFKPPSP